MEVIGHVSEGGLGPLRQALCEGGDAGGGGEGALAAAHAACLIPQKPRKQILCYLVRSSAYLSSGSVIHALSDGHDILQKGGVVQLLPFT